MWFNKSKAIQSADEILDWAKKKGMKVEKVKAKNTSSKKKSV